MSDPLFLENFRYKLRKGEVPVSVPPQKVLIKKQKDIFKSALTCSFLGHGSILIFSVIVPFLATILGLSVSHEKDFKESEFRNAIRVDVVGLPTLKLEELQKIDPTQEMGKQDKPKDEEEVIAAPSEDAMKLPAKKEEAVKEIAAKDAANKLKKAAAEKGKKKLDDLRASLRLEQRRKKLVDELKSEVSAGEGRTPLAGNLISEGYSVTGDVATDMDVYQGYLKAHLRKTWNLPGWMEASSLSARVLAKLSSSGRILTQEFLRPSGNSEFDRYVAEALKNAEPFPVPPPSLQRKIMEEGIEWGFPQ